MNRRFLVQVVATTVIVVFALGIWLTGGKVDLGWLRFFSYAVLAATALLWLWDRVVWGTRLVQMIPTVPRNLSGTWRGTLSSLWVDPSTKTSPPPKPAYLVVRQTASALRVTLLTDESRSISTLAAVSGLDGAVSLDYLYLNRPHSRVEDRSRMHHGSASLDVIGRPVIKLAGRYWTDRDSKGELEFVERQTKKVEGFEEAEALYSGTSVIAAQPST